MCWGAFITNLYHMITVVWYTYLVAAEVFDMNEVYQYFYTIFNPQWHFLLYRHIPYSRVAYIQGVPKRKKSLNIYVKSQIINIYFFKIRPLTHNYICGEMSKYQVCILSIH